MRDYARVTSMTYPVIQFHIMYKLKERKYNSTVFLRPELNLISTLIRFTCKANKTTDEPIMKYTKYESENVNASEEIQSQCMYSSAEYLTIEQLDFDNQMSEPLTVIGEHDDSFIESNAFDLSDNNYEEFIIFDDDFFEVVSRTVASSTLDPDSYFLVEDQNVPALAVLHDEVNVDEVL